VNLVLCYIWGGGGQTEPWYLRGLIYASVSLTSSRRGTFILVYTAHTVKTTPPAVTAHAQDTPMWRWRLFPCVCCLVTVPWLCLERFILWNTSVHSCIKCCNGMLQRRQFQSNGIPSCTVTSTFDRALCIYMWVFKNKAVYMIPHWRHLQDLREKHYSYQKNMTPLLKCMRKGVGSEIIMNQGFMWYEKGNTQILNNEWTRR
jgi:hypothetical protein